MLRQLVNALFRKQPVERHRDPTSLKVQAAVGRAKLATDRQQEALRELLDDMERGRETHS
ncbi:MAG TPA: hypothetical protein VGN97_21910 [Mesorhizobium sp.]|jgi:hypothetical protein|nr:hypothetical protein [Mesorhizobium sp.]